MPLRKEKKKTTFQSEFKQSVTTLLYILFKDLKPVYERVAIKQFVRIMGVFTKLKGSKLWINGDWDNCEKSGKRLEWDVMWGLIWGMGWYQIFHIMGRIVVWWHFSIHLLTNVRGSFPHSTPINFVGVVTVERWHSASQRSIEDVWLEKISVYDPTSWSCIECGQELYVLVSSCLFYFLFIIHILYVSTVHVPLLRHSVKLDAFSADYCSNTHTTSRATFHVRQSGHEVNVGHKKLEGSEGDHKSMIGQNWYSKVQYSRGGIIQCEMKSYLEVVFEDHVCVGSDNMNNGLGRMLSTCYHGRAPRAFKVYACTKNLLPASYAMCRRHVRQWVNDCKSCTT